MAEVMQNPPRKTYVAGLDKPIAESSLAYAANHGVSLDQLIECALVTFMAEEIVPVPIQRCAIHGHILEANSSGTVDGACPECDF